MNFYFIYNKTDGTLHGLPYMTASATWTNIPDGCAILGPIDESDAIAQSAATSPTEWTVQNGALVHSNAPTDQERLDAAKAAQKAQLNLQMLQSFAKGFTSACDTSTSPATSRTYPLTTDAYSHYLALRAMLDAGDITTSKVKAMDGTKVVINATNIKTLVSDAYALYMTNGYDVLWQKEDDVDAIQLANYSSVDDAIAAVQAITFSS